MSQVMKILLSLALLASFTTVATAAMSMKHIQIPVNPFPPWVIETSNEIEGIDVEIIKMLSQELGFTYEFLSCPFSRCLKKMESGKGDLMLGLFKSTEREAYLLFIEPGYIEDDPKAFYVRPNAQFSIDTYDDLKHLEIGVVRGTRYFPQFDDDESLKKRPANHDLLLIRMLIANRIDTFIGTPSQISYLKKKENIENCFVRAPIKLASSGLSHIAISKKSPLRRDKELITATVKKLKKLNRFENIAKEYMESATKFADGKPLTLEQCKKF